MKDEIIDMHLHFGSPPDAASGCFWSDEFAKSVAYYAILLITRSLFKKIDFERVKSTMLSTINGSKYVHKSVLLALDLVYDKQGQPHPELTHLHVPNQFLATLSREHERVLWGASVHPYRKDWETQLDFCLENGAVLCKLIPSSQMFNPADSLCISFYKKLAAHNLPLLCHCGPEPAIPTSDKQFNEFNNPKYLRTALDLGVTVIIAHCALPYFWIFDVEYQDDYREFLKLVAESRQKNWRLYADLSALTTPTRNPYIEEIQRIVPPERLLFGSDYPVPVFEMSYQKSTSFFHRVYFMLKMLFVQNLLDKNYLLIKKMGFDDQIYTNAKKVFNEIKREKENDK